MNTLVAIINHVVASIHVSRESRGKPNNSRLYPLRRTRRTRQTRHDATRRDTDQLLSNVHYRTAIATAQSNRNSLFADTDLFGSPRISVKSGLVA